MKRFFAILLTAVLLLSGCSCQYRTDVTMEEIVAAYEAAGYSVWSESYDEKLEHGEIGSIQANHPDGDYIYFSIFETEEEAEACKDEYYHPIAMGLFSIIYGDPSWVQWHVFGNIIAQYDEPEFMEPFLELMLEK